MLSFTDMRRATSRLQMITSKGVDYIDCPHISSTHMMPVGNLVMYEQKTLS